MHDEPLETPPVNAAGAPPIVSVPPSPSASPTEPAHDRPAHDKSAHDRPVDEAATNPAWANDLRKLYNAVVEEPLPDSLIDLLSQLDAAD